MKKTNTIIIATIIAVIVFAMFAFQPTKTEASNNAIPTATPRKITKPKMAGAIGEGASDVNARKSRKQTNNRTIKSSIPSNGTRKTVQPKGVIESIGTKYTMRKRPRRSN